MQVMESNIVTNIVKLIKLHKISEEILIFDSHICNISVINLDPDEIDTTFSYYTKYPATGLMYLVSADYIPNFKNGFSFMGPHRDSIVNDYAICYNHTYIHTSNFIDNMDSYTRLPVGYKRFSGSTINIFFTVPNGADMIRHVKILNNFQSVYSYEISIGNNNYNYINLGTFETNFKKNIIFDKYVNLLLDVYGINPAPVYIKITVSATKKSDWNKLNYSLGEIFFDTDLRDKLKVTNGLFIEKNNLY